MFLITLANELFSCLGGVVGEATPGVPRLPLSHHQDGGWSWGARELSRHTMRLLSDVFFPGNFLLQLSTGYSDGPFTSAAWSRTQMVEPA